jgi:sporulation protein YlmC with PRC-barrel domain
LFTSKSLHRKAVLSLDDGERIGYVEDLLIDVQGSRLGGFVVKGEKGEFVLPREQVQAMGGDAITVTSVSATQSGANALPGLRPFSEIHGLKVVDSAGNLVGQLHDIDIDPATGAISSLDVHSGGVFGVGANSDRIPISDVRSFGPELIMVDARASQSA